jgi:hypothetical protein
VLQASGVQAALAQAAACQDHLLDAAGKALKQGRQINTIWDLASPLDGAQQGGYLVI